MGVSICRVIPNRSPMPQHIFQTLILSQSCLEFIFKNKMPFSGNSSCSMAFLQHCIIMMIMFPFYIKGKPNHPQSLSYFPALFKFPRIHQIIFYLKINRPKYDPACQALTARVFDNPSLLSLNMSGSFGIVFSLVIELHFP